MSISKKKRKLWLSANILVSALYQDIRNGWLGRRFLTSPTELRFSLGSIDELHCIMADTQQYEQGMEITVEELRKIVINPLFRTVQCVEINNGELNRRSNLPAIASVFVQFLPKLKSVRLNCNVSNPQIAIEQTIALANITQSVGIQLRTSISLGVCDEQGRSMLENLDPAMEIVRVLAQNNIPVSVNCALTPLNCYQADDVLLWYKKNNIQDWAFKIGIASKRHESNNYYQKRSFTPEQRFHLAMFFEKLIRYNDLEFSRKVYYKNLCNLLSLGTPHTANCVWQASAVVLDLQGNISYCPPQSPILGSATEQSALQIYQQGLPERRRIIQDHCHSCQYDLANHLTTAHILKHVTGIVMSQWQKKTHVLPDKKKSLNTIQSAEHNSPKDWNRVLITGWYGTETTGDKAILGEILQFIKQRSPHCEIVLTTINQKISLQTNRELEDLSHVTLVDIAHAHQPSLIESLDAVIMGGGPLMQTRAMDAVWRIFMEANRQRKARIIFGCGVGPFQTDDIRQMTAQVLQMSTAGFFRDQESFEYALQLAPDVKFGVACDPAFAFLQRWLAGKSIRRATHQVAPQIATLLRANTNEFAADMAKDAIEDSNAQAANRFAAILESVCIARAASIKMLAMNAPWIGGDDRLFNRLVVGSFTRSELVHVERGYFSLDEVVHSLLQANAAIAMRYHGHIFCMALGIPFLSIDYTGTAGKVYSLTKRIDYQQWSIPWKALDEQRAVHGLQVLLDEEQYWSEYLKQQSKNLVDQLQKTYVDVFGEI